MPLRKPNTSHWAFIKDVPALEMAKRLCDREGREQQSMVRVGESHSICLGPK